MGLLFGSAGARTYPKSGPIFPLVKKPITQVSLLHVLGDDQLNWKQICIIPRKATVKSSLRVFQCKILNDILYLNDKLYKFGIASTPLSSLFSSDTESVLHLFCHCSKLQALWSSI